MYQIDILQIVLSIVLITLVLLQQNDAGFYSSTASINRTRRGSEKFIFNSTIFVAILLVGLSIANFLL